MSGRRLAAVAVAAVVAAMGSHLVTPYFEVALLLLLVAAGAIVLAVGRWRPARVAIALAAVAVTAGGVYTAARVVEHLDEERIEFRGTLDAEEILGYYQPEALRAPNGDFTANESSAYLHEARGVATRPDVPPDLFAFWAFVELAPWLLAAALLALLLPVLRAADRGDPFAVDAGARLRRAGSLLLLGIPGVGLLRFILAEVGGAGAGVSPVVEAEWAVSVGELIPGALVLALAEVFRRGAELRDLDRHTV